MKAGGRRAGFGAKGKTQMLLLMADRVHVTVTVSDNIPQRLSEGSEKSEQAGVGDANPRRRKRKGTSHAWPEFTDRN